MSDYSEHIIVLISLIRKHQSLTNDALRCRLVAEGMKNGPLAEIMDRSPVLVGLERDPNVL